MELLTQRIQAHGVFFESTLQLTLENDINVPDSKPDIESLIKTNGEIHVSGTSAENQRATLKGVLAFRLLYTTGESIQPVHSLHGEIPFEEVVNMDCMTDEDTLWYQVTLEDCQTELINSRKINVRAIVSICCSQEQTLPATIGTQIVSDEAVRAEMEHMLPTEHLYQRFKEHSMSQLLSRRKDILRIKEEFTLPKGKPNISNILYYELTPKNFQTKIMEDGIRFIGDIQLFVLYMSETEERNPEYIDVEIPFDNILSCEQCSADMIHHIEFLDTIKEMELKCDEDGENRIIDFEIHFNLKLEFYEDQTLEYLDDAYSTNCTLELTREPVTTDKLLMKNQTVVRISELLHLSDQQPEIREICSTTGHIRIDEKSITEDGIQVEGMVAIEILYFTEDEQHPIALMYGTVPFSQLIEINGIETTDTYKLESNINQINVMMLDHTEAEVKISLSLCAITFRPCTTNMVTGLREAPLDTERLRSIPGLTGYIVQPNDKLWDIAKEYNTTTKEIMTLNQLEQEELTAGMRLLLLKQLEDIS